MNSEIEVGEYVRTKQGYIGKYQKSVEGFDEFTDSEGTFSLDIEQVTKHSKNLIDLIEVGGYVNGSKVEKINCSLEYTDDDAETGVSEVDNGLELETGFIYFENEIKSVATKEQFKSIEYVV